MIITEIIGGLGNQMFQYAFHIYLKDNIKNEKKYFLDINRFDDYDLHHGYELEKVFNLNENYINKSLHNKIKKSKIHKVMKRLYISKIKVFNEDIYREVNINIKSNNYNYFVGYWQNFNYIRNNEDKLKEIFSFNMNKIDEENKKILRDIKNNNSISIHVRRGDYLNNKNIDKFGNICNEEYYLNSINYIEKNINNPKYFVFSNDIKYCKNLFGEKDNIVYVLNNKKESSFWDMFLMSECDHNIIANSSFSWWGAFLNKNKNKIILTPNKWFNTDDISGYILPEKWIKIDT